MLEKLADSTFVDSPRVDRNLGLREDIDFDQADEKGQKDTGATMSSLIRSAIEEKGRHSCHPDSVCCLGAEVPLKNEPTSTTIQAPSERSSCSRVSTHGHHPTHSADQSPLLSWPIPDKSCRCRSPLFFLRPRVFPRHAPCSVVEWVGLLCLVIG